MDLMYNYSDTQPPFVICEKHLGQKTYTINYNIEKLEEERLGQQYRYSTVTLPAGEYDRATVISTIIRHRYSDDEMQAIINNYLLDPSDEESIGEFYEMQNYRRFAKSVADRFVDYIG